MGKMMVEGHTGGNVAKVDSDLRLHTLTVSIEEDARAAVDGDGYNINTGKITLTTANESGVFYFKNNEDRDFDTTALVFAFGASDGTGHIEIMVEKNPTGGTVITDATAVDIKSNRNFGTSKTITADAFKGGEGKTFTGATEDHIFSFAQESTRFQFNIIDTLTKGDSLGVLVTPPAGNTSMPMYCSLLGHLNNPENFSG
jgi:hypothetical protein